MCQPLAREEALEARKSAFALGLISEDPEQVVEFDDQALAIEEEEGSLDLEELEEAPRKVLRRRHAELAGPADSRGHVGGVDRQQRQHQATLRENHIARWNPSVVRAAV